VRAGEHFEAECCLRDEHRPRITISVHNCDRFELLTEVAVRPDGPFESPVPNLVRQAESCVDWQSAPAYQAESAEQDRLRPACARSSLGR
jgi:hypothetical protein